MIRDVVWACVVCGTEAGVSAAGKCRACEAEYARGRGATIVVKRPDGTTTTHTPREIGALLPEPGTTGSAHCTVRDSAGDRPVYALGKYLGRIEQLGEARPGRLTLTNAALRFDAETGESFELPVLDITAIQPSSHALQLKTRHKPVFSIKFTDSSPKLWEERLQGAINSAYLQSGRGEVVEYQPRICTKRSVAMDSASARVRRLVAAGAGKSPVAPWQYRLCSWIARNAWKHLGGGVTVNGLENIPASGPFLVLPNHESYLETMLVPAVVRRPMYAMAKSTQFNVPFFGWLMAQVFAFPVRRFEIDPQAVRFLLHRFSEGYGAVIYIEGERTWDGVLQAARQGVIRLALSTGVPVIPCHVEGAFEAWPRWSSAPQRHPVTISFKPALELPSAASRAAREAVLTEATHLVRTALESPS